MISVLLHHMMPIYPIWYTFVVSSVVNIILPGLVFYQKQNV